MAQFCTKCGTPLAEGLQFCTGCGAAVGVPSAPAPAGLAPVAALAQTPPPVAPGSVSPVPAASSGSPVLKIILIVVAVLILLGLLSAGACVYMVYRAKQRVSQFEKQVHTTFPMSTQLPGGQAGPAIDLGVSVYPGATPTEAGSTMSMGNGAVKVQEYTTSDSVDKVTAFYKDKLGSRAMVTQKGQEALVQLIGSNGVLTVSIVADGNTGKTKFTISSIGK